MSRPPQYYMPYDSGDDTDADTGDMTDDDFETDDDEDIRIRREEDPRYAIIRAAGPFFSTSAQQLKYMEHAPGAEYTPATDISSFANYTYLDPPKTIHTSLVTIKSSNRDRTVWPSPFNFQLKLPKVYRNVTKFQLVQLSFPFNTTELTNNTSLESTFYVYLSTLGFSSTCITSCINTFTNSGTSATAFGLLEQNRLNSYGSQLLTKLEIPNGTYSNGALATELTTQANNTPPFNLISYEEFSKIFKVTRDILILFNEPGDNFHSKLSMQRYKHHSKETIMNTYYTWHDINIHPIITETIAFNAYYYPILKELVGTRLGSFFVVLEDTGLNKEQLQYYVLNNFLGLDSKLYYDICMKNRNALDEYRKNLTFEHNNINKYIWSYDDKFKRFQCRHETLHTSIKADINKSLDKCLCDELCLNSLSASAFNNLKTTNNINNTILDNLQINLRETLTNYFIGESTIQYSGGDYYSSISDGNLIIRSGNELHNDQYFTTLFNYTSTFGRQYGTYGGIKMAFTSFADYHSTISSYYMNVNSTTHTISSIYGDVYSRHHQYISTKYSGILPAEMINTKSYNTGQSVAAAFVNNQPVYIPGETFNSGEDNCVSTCHKIVHDIINAYYSCLPVNTITNSVNYRLGLFNDNVISFENVITFFNTVSTNNYNFLLQVNNDQSFNNMDITMNENYNITNETTGQIKMVYAKILTSGVGADETSQTCIQNPVLFPNTLGKLDKLEFKIYLDDDNLTPMWQFVPFFQQFSEWNAVFQIDEEIGFADRNAGWGTRPTIPMPDNPNAMPYLALTSQ
jgi:hypothetical protein